MKRVRPLVESARRGLAVRAARVESSESEALVVSEAGKREHVGPSQLRLRVDSAGVNNSDLSIIRGRHHLKPAAPFVPGFELAGEVVEVGKEVGDLAVGDRVLGLRRTGLGAWSEEAVVWREEVVPIPHRLSYELAASLPVAYCSALLALKGLKEGSTVLVLTTQGSTGVSAVDVAQNLFKCRVVAGTDSEAKCAELRSLGVAATVDTRAEDLHKRVRKLTDGHGVDVVVDTVGGDLSQVALECLRPGGRLGCLGWSSGKAPSVGLADLLRLQASVSGHWLGGWANSRPKEFKKLLHQIVDYADQRLIHPYPARSFPLSRVNEALEAADRGAPQLGKVILTLREEHASTTDQQGKGSD